LKGLAARNQRFRNCRRRSDKFRGVAVNHAPGRQLGVCLFSLQRSDTGRLLSSPGQPLLENAKRRLQLYPIKSIVTTSYNERTLLCL